MIRGLVFVYNFFFIIFINIVLIRGLMSFITFFHHVFIRGSVFILNVVCVTCQKLPPTLTHGSLA